MSSPELRIEKRRRKLGEIDRLAEMCARVLESQSGSAEVFIPLATRAWGRNDYVKLDKLSETIGAISAGEIAEIVRQAEYRRSGRSPRTLAMLPVRFGCVCRRPALFRIATTHRTKSVEFDSEDARDVLDTSTAE